MFYRDMSSWAGIVPPSVPAIRLLIAIVAMPNLVSFVALPMWGRTMHLYHAGQICRLAVGMSLT